MNRERIEELEQVAKRLREELAKLPARESDQLLKDESLAEDQLERAFEAFEHDPEAIELEESFANLHFQLEDVEHALFLATLGQELKQQEPTQDERPHHEEQKPEQALKPKRGIWRGM